MVPQDVLGTLGVLFYAMVLLPHIYDGYKRKHMEGLSYMTFMSWVFGDVLNLLSSFLLDQILAVKATAILFVVIDIITLFMYFYYERWRRPNNAFYRLKMQFYQFIGIIVAVPLAQAQPIPQPVHSPRHELIGSLFAWLCAIAYFGSRFPQILTLLRRRIEYMVHDEADDDVVVEEESWESSSGYLVWVFMICANICYTASLVMEEVKSPFDIGHFFQQTFPYMLGSVGTIPLDIFILVLEKK